MACGAVHVNVLETVYSDNPHVDPVVVAKPASLDAATLAWVAAFPRRTKSGDGFMRASVRATTVEELARAEAEADDAKGSLAERLRAAGGLVDVPDGSFVQATRPFQLVYIALALSSSSTLISGLVLAEGDSIAAEIARDWLASRGNVLGEVAASIHALRPANIAIAIRYARDTATAAEIEALRAAIREKIAKAMPHSSDISELNAMLDTLAR